MKKTVFAALLAGAASFACTSYAVDASDTYLHFDSASETLTLFEIQRGLSARDANEASAAIEKLLVGQRQFPPDGGLISIDFDEEISAEDRLEWGEAVDRIEAFSKGVSVDEVGLFLDPEGRLCLYRRSRFREIKLGLEVLNAVINRSMLEDFEVDSRSFPVYDESTAQAWLERARAGGEWIRVEDGTLVIDLPMSAESAARCLEHLAHPEGTVLHDEHWLLTRLTGLVFRDYSVQLHFAGGPDGWIHFESPEEEPGDYDSKLLNRLRESGHDFSHALGLAEVRERMHGR